MAKSDPATLSSSGNGFRPWVSISGIGWRVCQYESLGFAKSQESRRDGTVSACISFRRMGRTVTRQVCEIPPYSGRSAYDNDTFVPRVSRQEVEVGLMRHALLADGDDAQQTLC